MTPEEKSPRQDIAATPSNQAAPAASGPRLITPLAYEAPADRVLRDPQAHPIERTIMFSFGVCFAAGLVLALTACLVIFAEHIVDFVDPHVRKTAVVAAYAISLVFSLWLMWRFLRKQNIWTEGRCFILGCIVGIGVGLLIDGVCFALN